MNSDVRSGNSLGPGTALLPAADTAQGAPCRPRAGPRPPRLQTPRPSQRPQPPPPSPWGCDLGQNCQPETWGSLTSPKPPFPSTRYCLNVFLVTGCLEKSKNPALVSRQNPYAADNGSTEHEGAVPWPANQAPGRPGFIAADGTSQTTLGLGVQTPGNPPLTPGRPGVRAAGQKARKNVS